MWKNKIFKIFFPNAILKFKKKKEKNRKHLAGLKKIISGK